MPPLKGLSLQSSRPGTRPGTRPGRNDRSRLPDPDQRLQQAYGKPGSRKALARERGSSGLKEEGVVRLHRSQILDAWGDTLPVVVSSSSSSHPVQKKNQGAKNEHHCEEPLKTKTKTKSVDDEEWSLPPCYPPLLSHSQLLDAARSYPVQHSSGGPGQPFGKSSERIPPLLAHMPEVNKIFLERRGGFERDETALYSSSTAKAEKSKQSGRRESADARKIQLRNSNEQWRLKLEETAYDIFTGKLESHTNGFRIVRDQQIDRNLLRRLPTQLGVDSGEDQSLSTSSRNTSNLKSVYQMEEMLKSFGVNTSLFGKNNAKTLMDLFEEYNTKQLTFEKTMDGKMMRQVKVVKVKLSAQSPFKGRRTLYEVAQRQKNWRREEFVPPRLPAKIMYADEILGEGVARCLLEELHLDRHFVKHHLEVDETPVRLWEETTTSKNYPGLQTVYAFSEVHIHLKDATKIDFTLGLPDMKDFSSTNADALDADNRGIIHYWGWRRDNDSDP